MEVPLTALGAVRTTHSVDLLIGYEEIRFLLTNLKAPWKIREQL
uniref:Uncharacterized protein n=1 Tax=Peronospora matthiolae TaxID=2874970 RepID=A0AAV1T829_9STRA